MRNLLAVVLSGLLLVVVGCQNKTDDGTGMAMNDVCPTCPGVQKMTTDGKCENCKMTADACSHCAGLQVATADGKCPACGMTVAKK